MADDQPATRRGNIGNEIFEQVEKIMAEEGLTRTQAFQKLSERRGGAREPSRRTITGWLGSAARRCSRASGARGRGARGRAPPRVAGGAARRP